jgi:hypothetical protein
MTTDELRFHLKRLIDVYVLDQTVQTHLLSLVNKPDVPTKAILAELEPFLSGAISQADAKVIKDIAFNFC